MPLPLKGRALAWVLACAYLTACETTSDERVVLKPVENKSRLSAPPLGRLTQVPRPTTQTRPVYPFALRRAGVQGEAVVEFLVMTDGKVGDAAVLRATDIRFGDAALECVKAWRFEPGMVDGQPVVCRMQVPIVFALQGG